MAMGLPCVASTAAWSGTSVANGEGILAADDAKEFADHVVRLLLDGEFRAAMARKARAAAEMDYRWDRQLASLDRVIAAVSPGSGLSAARERA
jgi:glycosyltransferase involved in cell wall biosynthesis